MRKDTWGQERERESEACQKKTMEVSKTSYVVKS